MGIQDCREGGTVIGETFAFKLIFRCFGFASAAFSQSQLHENQILSAFDSRADSIQGLEKFDGLSLASATGFS